MQHKGVIEQGTFSSLSSSSSSSSSSEDLGECVYAIHGFDG
jgi:hypothetical protein